MNMDDDNTLSEPRSGGLGLVTASCILAFGIGFAGYFVGQQVENGLMRFHAAHTVSVKGLAERAVKADLALWPMRFVATGNDLGAVQAKIETDIKTVTTFLKNEGLSEAEIMPTRVDVVDLMARQYRSENDHDNRFILYANIMIRSNNVDLVQKVSQKSEELVKSGVVLTTEGVGAPASLSPYYMFTRLNDVKLEMLADATHNARAAAEQFAHDAAVPLGPLVNANQGVFSILPGDPTPAAQEETQINKLVRVVSTVAYALAN